MSNHVKIKLEGADGKPAEIAINMATYANAAENKRDMRAEVRYAAAEQGVAWDPSKGDLLDQMMVASGLFDGKFGGNALTVKDLAKATLADGFRAPDAPGSTLGARLLFPTFILETMKAGELDKDGSGIISDWNSIIATTTNLNGQRAEQPIIDTRAPADSEDQRIAQLAEPVTMVSITTSQKAYAIPTNSIGLTVSDQALEVVNVDLLNIVMSAQARGQRIRNIQRQLRSMVLGDKDLDMEALPTVKASEFDSLITEGGVITKKAWIKWLRHNEYNANLTRVLTGIDEALLLDDQLAPRNVGTDNSKIGTPWGGVDFGIPTPKFMTFDQDTFGANIFVGLDPRYAIQRFVNVSASYDAIETYVMRRATSFRVDYGEMASRLYDEAWSVLSLEK